MADAEPDYSSLPLTERWTHKIWKVRKQAYEDTAKNFSTTPDESDPIFKPFLSDQSLWKGAVGDSNVAAQQDGIAALCAFLEFGGPQACIRSRNASMQPLVEKGLSSTRAATKTKSLDAILLFIELDTPNPIIEDMLPFLSHKLPKVIAPTLAALTAIFHAFGCKTVDPKPVLKNLPKVFGHADKNVRAEAQNLAVELYRWLKEAMKPMFWNDLKPVQQKELDDLFEKVKEEPSPKQERLLRSQQAAAAAAAAAGGGDDGADDADEPAEVDAFDLAEAVPVLSKIPKDFYENLGSVKWKERKDALDALFVIVNVPRIKEDDFTELVRALAKCMKDANIAVVTVAANCVDALAKGLRRGFGKYRSAISMAMFERLKEKKQSVADAIGGALDSVLRSSSLSDFLEETLEFLKNKNPQVKLETLRFLIRGLSNTPTVPSKAEVKNIAEGLLKLLTDTSEVVRSSAAEGLGILMKIIGERPMNPYLEGLDDIRKNKIKEFFDTAQVKAKDKPAPPPAPAKAAAPAGKRPVPKKTVAAPKKTTPMPAPAAAPVAEPSTPLAPKPTARSIPSKLGAPKSGLPSAPGAGLKLQKKLTGPGGAPPPNIPSPRRPVSQQAPPLEEAPAAVPKIGLGGRGLTGRSLGKPAAQQAAPDYPINPSPAPGLSSVDRAELEELRAEKERWQKNVEELRAERARLNSQLHELQNQNAQLIEDHTRDVLSIKAKETQLVRARSDAEAAEQTVVKQQREIDRLKRELSRAVRATSPPPADVSEHIYRDSTTNGYGHGRGDEGVPSYRRSGMRLSYTPAMSEEKENGIDNSAFRSAKMSPTLSSAAGSGTMSPTRMAQREREGAASSGTGSGGEGIESWKRAAEVTSQLKARIEQMKMRQGISKH